MWIFQKSPEKHFGRTTPGDCFCNPSFTQAQDNQNLFFMPLCSVLDKIMWRPPKVETVTAGVLQKTILLKILQKPLENICDEVSLSINLKTLQYRCFPVNFVKFLRTSFFTEHLQMNASGISPVAHWSEILRRKIG